MATEAKIMAASMIEQMELVRENTSFSLHTTEEDRFQAFIVVYNFEVGGTADTPEAAWRLAFEQFMHYYLEERQS